MLSQNTRKVEPRETIWILGGGRFGRLAARRLRPLRPAALIYVVEQRLEALSGIDNIDGIEIIGADAVKFISHRLMKMDAADWIVPAVPFHVAYHWIVQALMRTGTVTTLDLYKQLHPLLINPLQGDGGAIYASIADFRCPDDCNEPNDHCTITGKTRPAIMYRHLQNLSLPGISIRVVRSHQLAPGVGGYQVKALIKTLAWAKKKPSPMLLATACQCHAVLHTFRFYPDHPNGR